MLLTPEKLEKLATLNREVEIDQREIILGYAGTSPEFSKPSSFLIGGMTDQGKTVITAYLCCMAVIAGGSLLIIDPHCNEKKHGLMHKIEPLHDWFAREPVDFEDMSQVIERFTWLAGEYKRRKGKGGMQGKQPLFLVVDEFNELLGELDKEEAKEVSHIIGNIARGGRKHGMFVLLCAHNWNLSSTGGSDVRKNVAGRISVACESSEMAMVLNTSDRKQVESLCSPPLTQGDAIVKQPRYGLTRLSYPLTDREDCAATAALMRRVQRKHIHVVKDRERGNGNEKERPFPSLETATEAPLYAHSLLRFPFPDIPQKTAETAETPVSAHRETLETAPETTAETIKRMWQAGFSHRAIALRVRLSGRKYSRYQEICKTLGIPLRLEPGFSPQEFEELKARYNYTCPRCGKREPEIQLTLDHSVAKANFGTNNSENLQVLCLQCNQKKYTRTEYYPPEENNTVTVYS